MAQIDRFLNEAACFNLQFRQDVRHNRTGSPVYFCWKTQFVITGSLEEENLLRKTQEILSCGRLHYITGRQLRYSVQSIEELCNKIVPFFKKYPLSGKKKIDFEFWAKAVLILYQNKGKPLSQWSKKNFQQLIEIQKSMQEYKAKKTKESKWIPVAKAVFEHLK